MKKGRMNCAKGDYPQHYQHYVKKTKKMKEIHKHYIGLFLVNVIIDD